MRLRQAALTILGLYVCLAATVAHRHTVVITGVDVPWGLFLGLFAAYWVASAAQMWARLGALFFSLGWTAGLALPMLTPGDSYLVAGDWLGLGFMFASFALLALVIIGVANAD
jgi:hypothetical protein